MATLKPLQRFDYRPPILHAPALRHRLQLGWDPARLFGTPHFTPADQIAVALDGRDLGSPETRNTATVNPDNPSDVAEHSWMVWSLAPAQVDQGMHEIRVYLVARNPRLQPPLVVENVEIHINY